MSKKAKAKKVAAGRIDWTKRVGELKRVLRETGNARDTARHFGCSEGAIRQKLHALGLSGARKGTKKAAKAKAAPKKKAA